METVVKSESLRKMIERMADEGDGDSIGYDGDGGAYAMIPMKDGGMVSFHCLNVSLDALKGTGLEGYAETIYDDSVVCGPDFVQISIDEGKV